MNTPPLLIGAALVFWGWHTGFLVAGILMGIALESSRWLKARWEFSDEDFSRIWTFCTLLFLASALYAFTKNQGPANFRGFFSEPNPVTERHVGTSSARTAASLICWQPMIFFLFIAAQSFSSREEIPLHTISLILRRRRKKAVRLGQPLPPSRNVNVAYHYFAVCLFAACIQTRESAAFFWGFAVLVAWALWPHRSPRFALTTWAGALVLATTLGYFGQGQLGHLRNYLENFNPQWLSSSGGRGFDPSQSRTALGQIGRIKTSGRIAVRLKPGPGSPVPALLREASYRNYKAQVWFAVSARSEFENINHQTNETTWILLPEKTNAAAVQIGCYLDHGKALLPLPEGSGRLENLPAYTLQKNSGGAVLAEGPGLLIFDALYGPGASIDSSPTTREDLAVPFLEQGALDRVIAESGLSQVPREEVLRKISGFFQEKFSYSSWQESARLSGTNATPLTRFLLHSRSGHCEYFATATVLLLRRLEIPARYAVGYAVHENSGNGYVVRERDAHAWCIFWNDKRNLWQDFDTTPASWVEAEGRNSSGFQLLSDLWSRTWFEFSKIRWGQTKLRQYLLWALGPILGLLLYQILFRSKRSRQRRPMEQSATELTCPGLDSEFYQLEKELAGRGMVRNSDEPLSSWLLRAVAEPDLAESRTALQQLLRLHYRYRFDPRGLNAAERDRLRQEARVCLANLKGSSVQRVPRLLVTRS